MAGVSKKQQHTRVTHLWKAAVGPPGVRSGSVGGDSGRSSVTAPFPC